MRFQPNFSRKTFTMENPIDAPRLPRKRRSLAQELVTVLSEQIRDGHLKRGDKLPTESAIMDAHGVSRTVVREAISRLQAAGQVETRHGIGTFVLDTPSPSGFRIDPATVVTLRDVLAILELRISLEVESAGLAAQRRSARAVGVDASGSGCVERKRLPCQRCRGLGFPVSPANRPVDRQSLLHRHHDPPGHQHYSAHPPQFRAAGP